MKFISVFFLIASAGITGCTTAANNGNMANMRGAGANTGYVTNSETNARPSMPVNATNITPPSMNKVLGNTGSNHNSGGKSDPKTAATNSDSKANAKK